ncbi:putative Aldo-keto reductase family 1 member A1 [Blattamonas nauphoetae]|uniref:Aldo-keto reductase family 1 member A1 n=1 Tax=Blattamonas nauphoetae TaxID=2049346 RepID=A0ABQ9WXV1_9EUKA|nr:putative Aldo-keto reductase family 1 member A1 [Blattamonas nauphoetae]
MLHSTLNTKAQIPRLGLGTWESKGDDGYNAILDAFDAGYRSFDLAYAYGNEEQVGRAFKHIFDSGKAKREDLFITSKLWCTVHRPELVLPAYQQTLKNLQLDYLDLYLVHWPFAMPVGEGDFPKDEQGFRKTERVPLSATWKAMEELYEKGLVKAIGVSNTPVALLYELYCGCKIIPAVNQVELHPFCQQPKLVSFCERIGVHLTAYSPLGRSGGSHAEVNASTHPVLVEIGKKHNKSAAQVALRWQIQRSQNISIIPKSTRKERIIENISIFDFELTPAEMEQIAKLDENRHVVDAAALFNVPIFN